MALHHEHRNGILVVRPFPSLDKSNVEELKEILNTALAQDVHRMVFDLSGLVHITSEGLRQVLETGMRIGELKGQMVVAGLGPDVGAMFEMSGFFRMYRQFESVDLALAALS